MNKSTAIVPLVDLVLLALGGILASMTQMQVVRSLPVNVTRIGPGTAIVQQQSFVVVTVTAEGLMIDGQLMYGDELIGRVRNKKVVLRVDRRLPTEETIKATALLAEAGAEITIEVEEGTNPIPLT
jgi:biopolymer transport protein ExbD